MGMVMHEHDEEFSTMLAGKIADERDVRDLQYPLIASPKLDGIRGHIIDGGVYSRNLKLFPNVALQHKFGLRRMFGIDGELICGSPTAPDVYRSTQSHTSSQHGVVRNMHFYVFDCFALPRLPFHQRLITARHLVRTHGKAAFKMVPHKVIANPLDLLAYEARCVERGYEGTMVRSIDGPYKYGRATFNEGWLLKLKRFEDSEAEIIGADELLHNENERDATGKRSGHKAGKRPGGKLGSLHVRDIHTGVEFNIGSGFTDEERVEFWALYVGAMLGGRIVKYRYFPTGSKTRPRFPTFVGFRDPIDTQMQARTQRRTLAAPHRATKRGATK